jgi:hypothetical protein
VREKRVCPYLSELADVADPLTLQGAEVLGDSAVLEVDNTSEGLIKKRADRGDGKVAGFGLYTLLESPAVTDFSHRGTYSKGMNHSLEAHVNFTAANDLRDIGGIIRFKQSDLEAFFLEKALALGQV